MKRVDLAAIALCGIGLAQMTGDLLQVDWLKGIAAATQASPAPKVFSSVRGLETFSTRFFIEWPGGRVQLTPERYSKVRGPYNRRNVYGAALAYAPVLPAELRDPVLHYALCGDAPLLRELGLSGIRRPAAVVLEPVGSRPTKFEARCR